MLCLDLQQLQMCGHPRLDILQTFLEQPCREHYIGPLRGRIRVGNYRQNKRVSIVEVNTALDVSQPAIEIDTAGGMVILHLRYVPSERESVIQSGRKEKQLNAAAVFASEIMLVCVSARETDILYIINLQPVRLSARMLPPTTTE